MKLKTIFKKGACLKMQCHKASESLLSSSVPRIVLVGNPNVGKSVLFGLLSGKYATVSNYPGTTVEVTQANIVIKDRKFLLIDTPGINSLLPMSEDEMVTRNILLQEKPYCVVLVGDAKNLKRALYVFAQLSEMALPVVIDLNMEDEAKERGIEINKQALRALTGVEVVGTIAVRKKGIKELKEAMQNPSVPAPVLKYPEFVEKYIEKLTAMMPESGISKRALAVMILSGDETLRDYLRSRLSDERLKEIEMLVEECQSQFSKPLPEVINETKIRWAEKVVNEVQTVRTVVPSKVKEFIEKASIHPVGGWFILAVVLFLFYEAVGVFGAGILVDFLEGEVFGAHVVPFLEKLLNSLIGRGFVYDLFVGQYGMVSMALTYAIGIILPITTTFFLTFSILEDSGYIPRLATFSNRIFRKVGLTGKAILPMLLGLGCGTMAIMTTRVLETRRDRIIATFLIALGIPCSAQLGAILGMMGAVSAYYAGLWFFTIFLVLFVAGLLASRIIKGDKAEFFMELPPLRVPVLRNVLRKTYERAIWYIREVVPLFIWATLALFIIDKIKLLGILEKGLSPLVKGVLGLPSSTAPFFIIGFLRRDYGAAGLFDMVRKGLLSQQQILVSMVTITLFVPCLASFLMIVKERGLKVALAITTVVFFLAFSIGGVLNLIVR